MNFSAMKQELADRGYTMLSDTRRGIYINRARQLLDSMYPWPYLEADATGVAPLAISDLGQVEAVLDIDNDVPLTQASWDDLLLMYGGDLSTTGSASYWYIAWPSGVPTVATYPVTTNTIAVQCWRVPADLTGTDTPAAPARFHGLIIDIAERMASREAGRDASVTQAEIDQGLSAMVNDLMADQGPRFVHILNADDA